MNYWQDLFTDLRCVWHAAWNEWDWRRHLRRGSNPDELPF